MNTIIEINGQSYDLTDIKYIQKMESENYYLYGVKIHFSNVKPTIIWFNQESTRDKMFSVLIQTMNKIKAKRGY